jgi:glycerophosphoryl diester phosphodiesterase
MQPTKIEHKNVKMIAHRGAGKVWMENSLPAFQNSAKCSYWGIETDIHCTRDGKFILIHDDTTDRVTGEHYVVEENDFEALRNMHLSGLEGDAARLPTLEEYVNACKSGDKYAVLELKNKMPTEEIEKIILELEKLDYLQKTVFISFAFSNMEAVRALRPDQPAQFLIHKDNIAEKVQKAIDLKVDIDIRHTDLNPSIVDSMHQAGLKVNVWTVNDPDAVRALAEMGVDYITTDIFE